MPKQNFDDELWKSKIRSYINCNDECHHHNHGKRGAQGPQGPRGSAGINGTQGRTGPQGNAGFDGAQGAQGSAGLDGVQGAQGVQGPQGVDGTAATAVIINNTSTNNITITATSGVIQDVLIIDSGSVTKIATVNGGTIVTVNFSGSLITDSSIFPRSFSFTSPELSLNDAIISSQSGIITGYSTTSTDLLSGTAFGDINKGEFMVTFNVTNQAVFVFAVTLTYQTSN
jgi:hypothetical protein